jgi:hypothetical protein
LLFGEGGKVIVGYGTAADGNESGEEDFVEGIINFPSSGISMFLTAAAKVLEMALIFPCPLSFLTVLTMGFMTLP